MRLGTFIAKKNFYNKKENILNMHYSKITDATLNNLIRKSSYIDEVTFLDNIPLFSWIDINITELCNRKCVFCPRINPSTTD